MPKVTTTQFNPSWIDKMPDWVEKLPLPTWLFYLVFHLVFGLIVNVTHWVEGISTWGQLDPAAFTDALWATIPLVFIHYVDNLAGTALDRFREMISCTDDEYEQLHYEFQNMPAWIVWLILGIVATVFTLATISDPVGFSGFSNTFSIVINLALAILGFSLSISFVAHTFRRVFMVNSIYRMVSNINVFNQVPIYSLSGLATRSAVGIVLIANLDIIDNVLTTTSTQDLKLALANTVSILLIGSIAIIFPLLGIHRKLVEEKERLIEENGKRIRAAYDYLNRQMDESDFSKTSVFEKGLQALFLFRDRINKVPTWPWDWGAIRGFVSAIFLPLAIWAIQSLLAQFL